MFDKDSALLVDDEPEHLDWLIDYLKAKGLRTVVATNVRQAIEKIERVAYRIYLIDLNIPLGGWTPTLAVSATTYDDYHGLYILKIVRSQGNPGRRVIAYSAHQNEPIAAAIKRLYCAYLVKGRPRDLKEEIDALLKLTPKSPIRTGKTRPSTSQPLRPRPKKKARRLTARNTKRKTARTG